MATELGKAYVQIMPSAQGISGSIQDVINPEATSAGKSAGRNIAASISSALGSAGKTLTKSITVPAMAAATAVGGIVGALGWGRLVGLDSARAKLQGLGYDAQSVERISELVNKSIQGTVTTMAEGVSIAAGGLAAGVKEGAELERYIKLVGDAAVGANRPVNDMAQIFNRVQGSGRLMTQELNMIEDGMPGFAMAMSESLGVTQEEFRKMVTDGKVSSEQFLDVMDSFAGDMSDAYAKSWQGMVANTKSNIGIIGENILRGVFEQSKESIAEFLEYLRSDDARAWAKETGAVIGQAFGDMVENIKNAIQWWTNLSSSTQKMFGILAGIAVAIGPILLIVSKLITTVITLSKGFGMLKVAAGVIGTALGAVTAPVWATIGAIAGLVAGIVILYKRSETFRNAIAKVFDTVKSAIQKVIDTVWVLYNTFMSLWLDTGESGDLLAMLGVSPEVAGKIETAIANIVNAVKGVVAFVKEIWAGLVAFWQEHGDMILQAVQNVWSVIQTIITTVATVVWNIVKTMAKIIWEVMQFLWPFVEALIVSVWNNIKGVIQGAIDVITGIIQFFSALFTGNWSALWDSVKQILSGAVQLVWNLVQLWFVGRILKLGKALFTGLRGIVTNIWNTITGLFRSGVTRAQANVQMGFAFIRNIINTVMNAIRSVISRIWNGIKNTTSNVVNSIKNVISNVFNSLKGIVTNAFSRVRDSVRTGINKALDIVKNIKDKFFDAGKNIVSSIADGIKGAVGDVTGAISGVASKVRNFLPFSPAKEGPLKDLDKLNFGGTISMGIDDGASEVQKAMESMLTMPFKPTVHNPSLSNDQSNAYATQQNQPIILQVDGKTFAQITGDYTAAEGGNRIRRIERGLA